MPDFRFHARHRDEAEREDIPAYIPRTTSVWRSEPSKARTPDLPNPATTSLTQSPLRIRNVTLTMMRGHKEKPGRSGLPVPTLLNQYLRRLTALQSAAKSRRLRYLWRG